MIGFGGQKLSSNKIFYLLLILFGIVISAMVGVLIKFTPFLFSHTVYACQEALNNMTFMLPDSTPLLFGIILVIVFLGGTILFITKVLKTKIYVANLPKYPKHSYYKVNKIAKQLGIDGKIDITTNNYSTFCYGLVSPRICISKRLIHKLTDDELFAVIAHEAYHLKKYDPLKILIGQVIAAMFFFIPTLKNLQNWYSLTKEIEADLFSTNIKGTSVPIKSALSKMINLQSSTPVTVAAFTQQSNIEARIEALINKDLPNFKLSFIKLSLSLIIVVGAFTVITQPIYSVGNQINHEYIFGSYGNQCAVACQGEIVTHNLFFTSEKNYSEVNYSANPN